MNPQLISVRRQELDWLRVFAVLVLLFYHTGMLFNTWAWHIKNDETNQSLSHWMALIRSWRMPLLFFISGAGTYFAFAKLTAPQFLVERFRRLIVPLIFGMILVVPPQVYYEHIQKFSNYWDFFKSVFNYIPFYKGMLNLHHLWFILYLFLYSLIGIPVILLLGSTSFKTSIKARILGFIFNPVVLLLLPPVLILISQLVFIPTHPGRAHFAFYLLFFLYGAICYSSPEHRGAFDKNRKLFLAASFFVLIAHVLSYSLEESMYPFETLNVLSQIELVSVFTSWFLVITVVAYGQHYLTRSSPLLTRIGEGTYPFYILHQTVVVILAYYICKLPWSINLKFWAISLLTLVICALFYEMCIRPYNVMRFLFGLKSKRPA